MESTHITAERILAAHTGGSPQIKHVLETLFPEVFEDDKVICRIGTTFKRIEYPENEYAIISFEGKVKIVVFALSHFWKCNDIEISELKDPEGKYITAGEFKKLSNFKFLNGFIFKK